MSGLDMMKKRIQYRGATRDDRIVKSKLDSFHGALNNSYQAETITLDKDTDKERKFRCLINPSRLTEQFDKKVISIDFEAGLDEGDVFYWDRTGRFWLVDLQQHTEEAYFRALIGRCDVWLDINGKKYWAVKAGPTETTTDWRFKHNTYFNTLNYSMELQLTKDSNTVEYFSRHKVISFDLEYKDADTGEVMKEPHRWQVVATDKYSSENTMQVYLKEYADNPMEDAMIEPAEPEIETAGAYIEGPRTVNGFDSSLVYTAKNANSGLFTVSSSKVKIVKMSDTSCVLDIMTGKAMEFTLQYKDADGNVVTADIRVKSI